MRHNHRFHIFPSIFDSVHVLETTTYIAWQMQLRVQVCEEKLWWYVKAPGWARKQCVLLTGAESGKLFTGRLRCLWSGYGQVLWKMQEVACCRCLVPMHLYCWHFEWLIRLVWVFLSFLNAFKIFKWTDGIIWPVFFLCSGRAMCSDLRAAQTERHAFQIQMRRSFCRQHTRRKKLWQ